MPQHEHMTPELLAPAGGPSALRAAVANGADAVYLGVDRLNARRSAENFTLETLAEACEFAHVRGVRVYLTANIVVLPNEMDDALDLVDRAWAAGVDAVIIQDLGLMRCVRTHLPDVRIHASTQVNAHSSSTVASLARMGASRVTLSRETSLDEIAALVTSGKTAGVEIESFVHGALCMCYSGQCLLSSLIGGRSANRGLCAQPCRLAYELVDGGGAVLSTPGAHLLSPKDLAGISQLPDLIAAGASSLKIEGRMKSAEYVAIVTGVYRAALDRAAASPDTYEVRDGEMSVLAEAFNRGFTQAYLTGERGNAMMSYTRPNNRGVLIGRIQSAKNQTADVTLETALSSDDLIEVWTGRGRFAQPAGALEVGGRAAESAPAGSHVRIALSEPAAAGDRVFRVRNAALLAAAARTFADEQSAPVDVNVAVRIVLGEPVSVTVTDQRGLTGSAQGGVVEPARTRAVSSEDVVEHVGRFGGSGFVPALWDVTLSPGAGIGFSELHRVRRDALAALQQRMLAPWSGRDMVRPRLSELRSKVARSPKVSLVATVADGAMARACLDAGADYVQVPVDALDDADDKRIVAVLPRICHDDQEAAVLSAARTDTVVAGTLGLIDRALGLGAGVETHWSLNAVNPYSVAELADAGARLVWLSPEVTAVQATAIADASDVPVGVCVLGRQEMMVTEHCVLMAEGDCSGRCGGCARRASTRVLRDRKGYEFPLRTDRSGRTHIYNAVPLDLTESLPEVLATGVSAIRLDLELSGPDDAVAQVRRVRRLLDGGKATQSASGPHTTGHFFRGVQ